jgi:hypothetical protein
MENHMSRFKTLAAVLCAAAVVSAPVMARQTHARSHHHLAVAAAAPAPGAIYLDGRLCIPAPRVGAFATEPWTNDVPCEPASGYNNGY